VVAEEHPREESGRSESIQSGRSGGSIGRTSKVAEEILRRISRQAAKKGIPKITKQEGKGEQKEKAPTNCHRSNAEKKGKGRQAKTRWGGEETSRSISGAAGKEDPRKPRR